MSARAQAMEQLELSGCASEFAIGPITSPAWCDWWEQRWGRENLDWRTLRLLDEARGRKPEIPAVAR